MIAALAGAIGGGPHPVVMTASIESYLLHLHDAPLIYGVIAGLVFAEVGLVVAFFIPGETSAVIGGVLASQHVVSLPVTVVVVAAAAIVGNFFGYQLGRWIGPWLLRRRLLAGNLHVHRAQELIDRRGGIAVLVGRFIAVVRAFVPGLSGIAELPPGIFALYTVIGGLAWAILWVLVGAAVGLSYSSVLHQVGLWTIAVVVAAVVAAVITVLVMRRRRARRADQRQQ